MKKSRYVLGALTASLTVASLLPAAPAAAAPTVYTFTSSADGFTKQNAQPNSEIAWDSANQRVSVVGNRSDAGDEHFTRALPSQLTTSTGFAVSSRWATTAQGNWQGAIPLFLGGSGVTDANANASTISVYYDSKDGNLAQSPVYTLRYRDAGGVLRINHPYTAVANIEHRFAVEYNASTRVLTMKVRNSANVDLASVSYTTGTNTNDGFTLDKVGVSSDGTSNSGEPVINGWVDDISVDVTTPAPVVYTFNTSAEGFTKQNAQPNSEIAWDSANQRVSVVANRSDAGDEHFTRALPATLTTSSSFTITSRWRTTAQGNWQGAIPLFVGGSGVTDANANPSTISVYYDSQDGNLGWAPVYTLRYRDAGGVLRINQSYATTANLEYRFSFSYNASTRVLTLKLRNAANTDLLTATYTTGTNTNDGFTLGKVGVSSDGTSNSGEPVINGWVDDISVDSTGGGGGGGNTNPVACINTPSVSGRAVTVSSCSTDADGDPLAVTWNWGDGTTHGTTTPASHTYACPGGTYTISLTVNDGRGGTSTTTRSVTATDPDTDGDGLRDCHETGTYGSSSSVADSDADGVSDGAEVTFWGTADWNRDIDGDGARSGTSCSFNLASNLCDRDADADGLNDGIEINHPVATFGSNSAYWPNPRSKDLYIEIDYMVKPDEQYSCYVFFTCTRAGYSARPTEAQLQRVRDAFSARGIRVVFDNGEMGGGNQVPYRTNLRFDDGGAGVVDFQDYKRGGDGITANFDVANRYRVFHYLVMGHNYNSNPSSSGVAWITDDDFFVSYGLLKEGSPADLDTTVAGTIIHELGHNLCLAYGATSSACRFPGIDRNYGATYPSSMNYDFQFTMVNYSAGAGATGDHNDWGGIQLDNPLTGGFEPAHGTAPTKDVLGRLGIGAPVIPELLRR